MTAHLSDTQHTMRISLGGLVWSEELVCVLALSCVDWNNMHQSWLSELWEALLELRIELQKMVNASNQLPQHDMWHQLTENKAEGAEQITVDELLEGKCFFFLFSLAGTIHGLNRF